MTARLITKKKLKNFQKNFRNFYTTAEYGLLFLCVGIVAAIMHANLAETVLLLWLGLTLLRKVTPMMNVAVAIACVIGSGLFFTWGLDELAQETILYTFYLIVIFLIGEIRDAFIRYRQGL